MWKYSFMEEGSGLGRERFRGGTAKKGGNDRSAYWADK